MSLSFLTLNSDEIDVVKARGEEIEKYSGLLVSTFHQAGRKMSI